MSSVVWDLTRRASRLPEPSRTAERAALLSRLVAAAILAQTLYFKLTYAPETRVIFENLGGRAGATAAALVELAAVLLLLRHRTAGLGAMLGLCTMGGAVATHLLLIGIAVPDPVRGGDDGGLLFGLALAVATACGLVAFIHRARLARLLQRFLPETR